MKRGPHSTCVWSTSRMKVVALISGGKDSCYNMLQCVAAGHEIVALANLEPEGGDELDSFMFQTVGHEGVSLYAEAMGLPLYRGRTRGCSLAMAMEYHPSEGDEVEDLYQLLKRVKEEVDVEGVSSGAVLSDYQRLRVENVCSRLGLVSLAYLWRREQAELLREMVTAGVHAVVIKVAAMGLTPEKHLGKTVEELYPQLCELHQQYGINVCGEGGEYETFTLDCPLFHKSIVIDRSEVCVHSNDAFAPVAYLRLKQLHLEAKPTAVSAPSCETSLPPVVPRPTKLVVPVQQLEEVQLVKPENQCIPRGQCVWLSLDGDRGTNSATEQTKELFSTMEGWLLGAGCGWEDVVLVYLYLADMAMYARVNTIYREYFTCRPPARVCVQLPLPEGVRLRMEVLVWRGEDGREGGSGRTSMHVQSISHWAPANIGPYSQAYTVSGVVFGAGQIGLSPSSMTLVPEQEQPALALSHAHQVFLACHAHLDSTLCGTCYYTSAGAGWAAQETWKHWKHSHASGGCPVVFIRVPGLPRGACVEWHFIAVKSEHKVAYSSRSQIEQEVGVVSESNAWCDDLAAGCWMVTIAPLPSTPLTPHLALQCGVRCLEAAFSRCGVKWEEVTFVRVCVPRHAGGRGFLPQGILETTGGRRAPLSLVVTEGFYGWDCPAVLQACKVHRPRLDDHDITS